MTKQRIGDWMSLSSGKKFWPLDPRPEDVDIEDIAHSLSIMNRFQGHSRWPYSVAKHSYECCVAAPTGFELELLLHDATEAYISDLIRPVKRMIPRYREIEDRIYREAIAPAFGLPLVQSKTVKEIDNRMLVTEASVLCEGEAWWTAYDRYPYEPYEIELEETTWRYDKEAFLHVFYLYGNKR
jgi:uncharacterized protein